VIYATGISTSAFTGIEIDGSARPAEFTHNSNKQVRGVLSATGLSAGSINVKTQVGFGSVTNYRIEITEMSGATGNFMLLF
jgi:hypothetical protein